MLPPLARPTTPTMAFPFPANVRRPDAPRRRFAATPSMTLHHRRRFAPGWDVGVIRLPLAGRSARRRRFQDADAVPDRVSWGLH